MAAKARGRGSGDRAGSRTVARLSDELNVRILRSVLGGEPLAEEVEADPSAAGHGQQYEVTPAGEGGLLVAGALEDWLRMAPGGPIEYSDERAGRAIAALASSWDGTLLHALAPGPRSTAELAEELGVSARRVERLLEPALEAGLVEAVSAAEAATDDGASFTPTEWARYGLAPLMIGARAERADPEPGNRPIEALDVEAALLLIVPLASVPSELSGRCRLVVSLGKVAQPRQAGITVTIERGRVVECVPGIEHEVDATAVDSIPHWFRALIDNRPKRLTYEGDRRLARKLVKNLGETLFGGG